jgi:hypothetical protein
VEEARELHSTREKTVTSEWLEKQAEMELLSQEAVEKKNYYSASAVQQWVHILCHCCSQEGRRCTPRSGQD